MRRQERLSLFYLESYFGRPNLWETERMKIRLKEFDVAHFMTSKWP